MLPAIFVIIEFPSEVGGKLNWLACLNLGQIAVMLLILLPFTLLPWIIAIVHLAELRKRSRSG